MKERILKEHHERRQAETSAAGPPEPEPAPASEPPTDRIERPAAVEADAPAEPAPRDRAAELEDKYKRAVADLANLHRRFQREREQLAARSVAGFVENLLPMVDNMSHALKAAHESHDPAALIEGFRQLESQLLQIFRGSGIEPIETVGTPFDPEIHHAVVMEPTDAVPPGTVTEELGRGFKLGDFVIRPAQVKVAARPAAPEETEERGE